MRQRGTSSGHTCLQRFKGSRRIKAVARVAPLVRPAKDKACGAWVRAATRTTKCPREEEYALRTVNVRLLVEAKPRLGRKLCLLLSDTLACCGWPADAAVPTPKNFLRGLAGRCELMVRCATLSKTRTKKRDACRGAVLGSGQVQAKHVAKQAYWRHTAVGSVRQSHQKTPSHQPSPALLQASSRAS